jgi:hypothetical protein
VINQDVSDPMPPNNAINADVKHARAICAHVFAAGYGGRYVSNHA